MGEGASSLRLAPNKKAPNKGGAHSTPNVPAGGRSGIVGGALFGGTSHLSRDERALGRKLAIARVYYRFGEAFPNVGNKKLMEAGTTLLISYDTVPGGATYSEIAAGKEDASIRAFLKSVDRAAVQYRLPAIYVSFEHEANNPPHHWGLGTAAQFVAAWDHIHQLAASANLNWNQGGRLHWVDIMTHWGFDRGSARLYWPGTNEADLLAVDGYNSGDCRKSGTPHRQTVADSPASIFGTALIFANHVGVPIFISEYASTSYASSSVQPAFIRAISSYVAANREIAGAMYWDDSKGGRCGYEVDKHPASLAALNAMGHSPVFQGTPAG